MTRRAKPAAREKAPIRSGTPRNAGPAHASAILIAVLIVFCAFTRWGGTYPRFASGSWGAVRLSRGMSIEARRLALYDDTFPLLLYLREYLPEDAKVLLPPIDFIRRMHGGDIPLFAGAASTYSFIYPRVPVHYGRPSPFMKQLTHLLVWEHWGLEYVAPGEPQTEGNRIMLYDWPEGLQVSW
jgi:hypothetical protein